MPTVRSSGTYRLSVYEDGKEVGSHEADIQLPENIVSFGENILQIKGVTTCRINQTIWPN
jgi:hypothetical protein